jgi:hypothetical protein
MAEINRETAKSKESYWYWFFPMVSYLEDIEDYLEEFFENIKTSSADHIKEEEETLSSKELDELRGIEQDNINFYEGVYPRMLFNSFMISCFSFLERDLQRHCRRLRAEKQIPISLVDLRGDNVLERSKLYLRLAGLALPCDDATWQELKQFYKIRNCIVHSDGQIPEQLQKDTDFMTYVKREKIAIHVDIVENDEQWEIGLTGQFCRKVADIMGYFLHSIYDLSLHHSDMENKDNPT